MRKGPYLCPTWLTFTEDFESLHLTRSNSKKDVGVIEFVQTMSDPEDVESIFA